MLEDAESCEDGETTIVRDGAVAIPVVSTLQTIVRSELKRMRYRRYYCRLDQLSDTLFIGINVAQKSRGFFGPIRGAGDRDRGPRMKRSSLQQLGIVHEVCKMSQTWTLGPRVSRGESMTTRRKVRSTCTETLDPGEVLWDTGAPERLFSKQQLKQWCKLIAFPAQCTGL